MPSVSAKQHRLMAAVATNPAVAKKTKIPQSVGKEFMEADKGKKFKGGGEMKESKAMVKKEIGFMRKKGAPKSMIKHEMKEAGMKKMASGGLAAGHKSADGIAHKGKTKGKEVKMAFGGAAVKAVGSAVKKAAAPMQMQNAARSAASQAAPKPNSQQLQFMSDKLRGLPMKPPTGGAANPNIQKVNTSVPRGAIVPQRFTQQQAQQREMARTTANAAKLPPARPVTQSQGQAAAALAKSPLLGKKAGGLAAGHKEADGIAKKGKTKAMQVKMAGGGKTKKYC